MELYQDTGAASFGLFVFLVVLAVALWKMAERAKEGPQWFALVPFLNFVLLLKIAKKPTWWLILFIIPFVNIVTIIAAMMALCQRFGMNKWWGLLSLVSPANLILLLYLAYGTEKPSPTPQDSPAAS